MKVEKILVNYKKCFKSNKWCLYKWIRLKYIIKRITDNINSRELGARLLRLVFIYVFQLCKLYMDSVLTYILYLRVLSRERHHCYSNEMLGKLLLSNFKMGKIISKLSLAYIKGVSGSYPLPPPKYELTFSIFRVIYSFVYKYQIVTSFLILFCHHRFAIW